MQLCVSVGLTAKDPVKHGWKWCLSFPVGRGSALHHSWCGRLTGFPLHTWFSPQLITNNVLFPGKHQYCFQVVQLCFVRTEKRVTFILCQPNEKGIFRMFRGLKLIFVFVLWFLKLYLVWWIKVVKIAFTCPVPPVPYISKTKIFNVKWYKKGYSCKSSSFRGWNQIMALGMQCQSVHWSTTLIQTVSQLL